MTISALRSASVSRWVSRRNCWFSSATGSRLDLGPRFCGANAWRTPASRSRRHVVNREEYKPSRRSSAPTPPEPLAWPASVRMRRLYSAVKRRRLACATTSGSGRGFGAASALPSVALRSRSLRSGSLRPTDGKAAGEGTGTVWLFIKEILSRPALSLGYEECLSYVGTEGATEITLAQISRKVARGRPRCLGLPFV